MLISELANKYKISVRTLRYYEALGLLTANRNEANVREFDSSQIKRLESILVFRQLNIKLQDIKLILEDQNSTLINQILASKLNAIENELYALNYAKRLLNSVLRTFGSDSSSLRNVEAFLNEQIFISKRDERWMVMLENTEHLLIEIGEGLIPIADSERSTSLIQSIKELRKHLSEVHGLAFDKIRLMDNTDELQPFEYRIKSMDEVLFRAAINADSVESQIDHIITSLKTILLSRLT